MITIQEILGITPFLLLLTMIATGPVLYPNFWHRYYALIAPTLGFMVLGYYLLIRHDTAATVETVADYLMFIALIGSLYIASSGILIHVHRQGTPLLNLAFLWGGAILSNIIGTTGASMLLIRPFIRLNKNRASAYHIIFFIFMVSNVGGALTAIADPPNFIGFLKGVPFFWTLQHNFLPWLTALSLLSVMFYLIDRKNAMAATPEKAPEEDPETKKTTANVAAIDDVTSTVTLLGKRNIIWLLLVLAAVFIDPNIFPSIPAIHYHGHHYSFIREIILCLIAFFSYRSTEQKILDENGFSFEPLKEVVFIFMGIFGTMMPALTLISKIASSPLGQQAINPHTLYWCTGIFSSILDNAPTYLNFLTAGMASKGLSVHHLAEVARYAEEAVAYLKATSIAAVFFGAMTYIGNAPNFMVSAIAVKQKIKMPAFGTYIVKYSIPYLLTTLAIIWVLFFG